MKCKLCEKFYKKYPLKNGQHHIWEKDGSGIYSSPVECAFKNGVFNTNNWSCKTMVELRELSGEDWKEKKHVNFHHRDDMRSASIGVLKVPESDNENIQQGYLIITWYKSRGRTGQAWVMWDEYEPKRLTLKTAEFIIKFYSRKDKKGGEE